MITVQVVAFAWLIVILVYFSTLTIGSRYITVIRSSDGDYFTNPDENCNSNSCDSYNSTTVGGYCVSSDECCRQCRCGFHAKTYIIRAKRCMSLDEIRQYEVIQTTNGKCLKFVLCISIHTTTGTEIYEPSKQKITISVATSKEIVSFAVQL